MFNLVEILQAKQQCTVQNSFSTSLHKISSGYDFAFQTLKQKLEIRYG